MAIPLDQIPAIARRGGASLLAPESPLRGVTAYLAWLSACGALLVALLVMAMLNSSGSDSYWAVLIAASALGGLQGAVIAIPLARAFRRSVRALNALSHGEAATPLEVNGWHPLSMLITPLNALIAQQQHTGTLRSQLTRQISEAAAQEERNRLARDLHDSIKQQIFSISVSAAAAQAHLAAHQSVPAQAQAALADVRQSAGEAMVEMRAMLQQLSPAPLEKSGLIQALRDQCESLAYRSGARVSTSFNTLPSEDRLPIGAQEAIFRIAQEALSNIARHARAQQVTLTLSADESQLTLMIQDDGQGFPLETNGIEGGGMGLNNMRERAAALGGGLHIDSAPGEGTTLTLHVPLLMPPALAELSPTPDPHEGLLSALVQQLHIFTFCIIGLIFPAAMIAMRLIHQPGETLDDPILVVILIGMLLASAVALPMALIAGRKTWRMSRQLRADVGPEGRAYLKLRRYRYLSNVAIWLVALWFVPMVWIGEATPLALVPLTVAICFSLITWYYAQSFAVYNRYLAQITPAEAKAEVAKMDGLTRGSWTSLISLVIVLIVTDVFRNGIQLFPQSRDAWMTTSMLLITAMLVVNQFLNLAYYRWMQRRLAQI